MSPVQAVIERTVSGMGYDLVDVEQAGGGLLRVYIDVAGERAERGETIRVEDCEQVSHQLSHVLTVEDVDYARLEVSSPGVDRPLKKPADFARFEGAEVSVRLRQPLKGRKNFAGVLVRDPEGDGRESTAGEGSGGARWALELTVEPQDAKGQKARKGQKAQKAQKAQQAQQAQQAVPPGRAAAGKAGKVDGARGALDAAGVPSKDSEPDSVGPQGHVEAGEVVTRLTFTLDEIERARLVPKLKF